MYVLNVANVNEALPRALCYLRDCGEPEQTRNGPALVAPGPVATVYRYPRERVLFDAERDANPFFHLFESLWILAGRRDVAFLSMFNGRIADYSDDGEVFHAAYGYRLRNHFGNMDQIDYACGQLMKNRQSRRAALQIWSALDDLGSDSKDLPCNDMVMLRVRDLKESLHDSKQVLDITVCNRSNDAIWGAYGANAVQFSFLQEYMASKIGVGVGRYTQMSHNLHVYTDNPYWQTWVKNNPFGVYVPDSPYSVTSPRAAYISPIGLGGTSAIEAFDRDLAWFFQAFDVGEYRYSEAFLHILERGAVPLLQTWFFKKVVLPMLRLYVSRDQVSDGINVELDWHRAGVEWVARRAAKATKE